MKKLLRRSLPFLILGAGIAFFVYLNATRPEAKRRVPPEPEVKVEVVRLEPVDYRVRIESQGTVRARTRSTLIPEVSGRILTVSRNFREGEFFNKGDVLLEIDPSDYRTALTVAEANLAGARVRLAEEEAQSMQAQQDWQRLGGDSVPSELVLRGPQLALARANLAAAEARVEEARRNLERTRIAAPYDGRVLRKHVDVGQVVGLSTLLAEVYAVDYAEIRLPLTKEQYAMLDIPENVRGEPRRDMDIPVTLQATFARDLIAWEGRIVRVEGAVDESSRQFFVIAQVDDPYGPAHERPLKAGLFVEAVISGTVLEDVYRLPRTALREARYVLTIDQENRIHRVPVDPLWSTSDEVVFREPSIAPGTPATVTQIALAIDGMHVSPVGLDAGPGTRDAGPGTRDAGPGTRDEGPRVAARPDNPTP